MSLIIFLVCMIILSLGHGFDDYKKQRASYYCDHYNRLPEDQRAYMKKLGEVVQNEFWQLKSTQNAAGHYLVQFMNNGRTVREAQSLWIMDHCKAKGIPCTKFIADEVAGVHRDENHRRRAADAEKYGWEWTQAHNYLYL